MTEQALSQDIEALLVARNLRGMGQVRNALEPGYFLRAARLLHETSGTVLIGTGFPVGDTFETDGPVGAIALYQGLAQCGYKPVIVCGDPLATELAEDYEVHRLRVGAREVAARETSEALARWQPSAIISIERPGLTAQGGYYNMRGEDISARCACFDLFVEQAQCPTIAIGDGGNEIGMGNITEALQSLDIVPSVTRCDELLVADVSNWGAYGLLAIIGYWRGQDLLGTLRPAEILGYLSDRGSVDGVTRENTLTEDGLDLQEGEKVLKSLRELTGFGDKE